MNKFVNKTGEFLRRETTVNGMIAALVIALILVLNVLLYVLVEVFGLYFYEATPDDLSISGNTDALFLPAIERGEKVKITFCRSEDELKTDSIGAYVYTTALEFRERYPELIELEYVNIITCFNSKGEFVPLQEYKTNEKKNPSGKLYSSSVIFESGENCRVMTDVYTTGGYADFFTLDANRNAEAYNGEEVMAAMIAWVLADEHKTAYFTQYHGETVDIALSNLLTCAGYYINVIDLRKEEIPEDAALLVVSNPRTDFERAAEGADVTVRTELERLEGYMDRGGSVYVALDPYVKRLPVLEGFLSRRGISFATAESGSYSKNIVKDSENAITTDGFTLVADFADSPVGNAISDKLSEYGDGGILLRSAAALKLDGVAKPLLLSSPFAVCESGGKVVDSSGSFTVAAYSEEKTENGGASRLFVVPSVYIAATDALVNREYQNRNFIYALLGEFFGTGEQLYGCNAVLYDTETLENLTMGTARLYTALIMAVPVIVAAVGTVIIIRRKNR